MSRLSEHLGWRTFEAPRIVGHWDASLQQTFFVKPKDVTLAPLEDRLNLSEKIGDVIRRLGPRWTTHLETQNCELTTYTPLESDLLAVRAFDAEREAMCKEGGAQFEMRHYLTLTCAPKPGAALSRVLTTGHSRTAREAMLERYRREVTEVRQALEAYVGVETMGDDRTATYLKSTVSAVRQKVIADDHDPLNETLTDSRFERGLGLSRLGDKYVAVLTLGGFPKRTSPQLLLELSKLGFEFRWVNRWQGMEREAAKRLMEKRERAALGQSRHVRDILMQTKQEKKRPELHRVDREQKKLADEAAGAMETLSDRGYGSLFTAFVITDESKSACNDKRADMTTALQDAGLVVRYENLEPFEPWLMSLPGNQKQGRRTYAVKSRNLADFLPTSSLYRGNPYDAQLAKATGVKRPWLQTADPTAYRVTTDSPGGAAHSAVFGGTGDAGKSTFLNHMGLGFFGNPRAQVISFSIGRSELAPCLMCDGAVYAPGDRGAIAMQPLAYVDDPDQALVATEWLQLSVESLGVQMNTERRRALEDCVKALASEPQKRRRMTDAATYLRSRSPDLEPVLRPFTHEGIYGHIFDGDNAQAWEWRPWTMIDLTTLIGLRSEAVAPALAHLLHRTTKRFDGRPTLVMMDEVVQWIQQPGLEPWVARVLDTTRKQEVRALLATQTPAQLQHRAPSLLASVKSSVVSRFYGADSGALSQAEAYADVGVTPVQLKRISELHRGQFLHVGKSSGKAGTAFARVFDLKAQPIGLALCGSSSTDDLAFLAGLRAKGCDGDEVMREMLRRKGLEQRARRLGVWDSKATTALAAE